MWCTVHHQYHSLSFPKINNHLWAKQNLLIERDAKENQEGLGRRKKRCCYILNIMVSYAPSKPTISGASSPRASCHFFFPKGCAEEGAATRTRSFRGGRLLLTALWTRSRPVRIPSLLSSFLYWYLVYISPDMVWAPSPALQVLVQWPQQPPGFKKAPIHCFAVDRRTWNLARGSLLRSRVWEWAEALSTAGAAGIGWVECDIVLTRHVVGERWTTLIELSRSGWTVR